MIHFKKSVEKCIKKYKLDMEFEWNDIKSQTNKEKHGVSFEEAVSIWTEAHIDIGNVAHAENGENRNATVGWIRDNLYLVIWTRRKRKTRIISVRRARKNEEKNFFQKIQNRG